MVTSFLRGHKIRFENERWVYDDDGELVISKERECIRCGKPPTKEGFDACLGFIEGVKSACCGHGVEKAYEIKTGLER